MNKNISDEEVFLKIQKLEEKIKDFPNGYISKKNINGKIRYYLQWQENHNKKSKYIPNNEISQLKKKIEERKELQAQLKELKTQISSFNTLSISAYQYKTNIKIGESLIKFVNGVGKLKKRDCFSKIKEYLYSETYGKVFILYGLRRTGKTTLIRQTIAEMNANDINKCAFMQITAKDNLANVNFDLKHLESLGYKYIFIDEATLMEDFIEGSAIFSDLFASSGMKIVLSGTDSLGFMFSEDEQLYDRCIMLHTTFIPYREFERVLGIKGIDEYIRFGGTMSISGVDYNKSIFANERTTNEYVDSAIARNIQHSLRCYQSGGHFRHLEDLYNSNELTSVINRLVEDINHRFTIDVLTKEFVSNDFSISKNNLRKDKQNANDIFDRIDKIQFTNRLREILEIKNKDEQSINIKEIHKEEIKEYFLMLDLIENIKIETIPVGESKENRIIFTQPGIRYAQADALIKSLLMDKRFQDISALDRKYILDRILSEIKGRMLEDIVLLETKKAKPNDDIFKLQFAKGEFDMVVVDNKNTTCEIYEIKHSDKIVNNQFKNLVDQEKCHSTEHRFGKIMKKCVIYRGKTENINNGISFINAEDYLRGLKN